MSESNAIRGPAPTQALQGYCALVGIPKATMANRFATFDSREYPIVGYPATNPLDFTILPYKVFDKCIVLVLSPDQRTENEDESFETYWHTIFIAHTRQAMGRFFYASLPFSRLMPLEIETASEAAKIPADLIAFAYNPFALKDMEHLNSLSSPNAVATTTVCAVRKEGEQLIIPGTEGATSSAKKLPHPLLQLALDLKSVCTRAITIAEGKELDVLLDSAIERICSVSFSSSDFGPWSGNTYNETVLQLEESLKIQSILFYMLQSATKIWKNAPKKALFVESMVSHASSLHSVIRSCSERASLYLTLLAVPFGSETKVDE